MRLALIGIATAVLLLASAGPSGAEGPPFFVGFTEDLPKEIGADAVEPATDLGASAFRITLMWDPGQTELRAADTALLDRAVGAAAGVRLVLSVYADLATEAPQDAAGRDAYCTYVGNALARYPAIRDVVIWNEPNLSRFWRPRTDAAAAYSALVARCYDVLHAARADVNVLGPALSPIGWDDASSDSPGAFIRALGEAYRASGRTRPLFDTIAHHGYGNGYGERPWRKHIGLKWISQGDWNKLMYNLWLAFDGTPQPIPGEGGTVIWYLEAGHQTTVEPGHAAAYHGVENEATVIPAFAGGEPATPAPSETSIAPDQHTQVVDAIRLAACQPHVGAYFNFLLFDEPTLAGWQSGAFWADRAPKPSHAAFEQAIGEANAGTVDCGALKGGRPSADFMPPSAPTGLSATAEWEPFGVRLQWAAAGDDHGPVTYRVYRGGAHVGTTAETTWTNASVAGATTYTYAVRALDAAGNLGNASAPVSVTTPDTTPVILAAGDIASCASQGDEATAALLDGLAGTVAALGDTAYESGTTDEFAECYEPSWGRHKSRTRPAVGNHEYQTPDAAGYYAYFGAAAGDPDEGYYSYDLGGWHVVVLNSECDEIGGCHAGSAQEQWLRAELAAHPADRTLAYMHHPRFSSGSAHGNHAFLQPLWQALYDEGADVVLAGHDHNYERFAPLTPAGALDTVHGLRSFVVGTGGKSLRPLGTLKPHSQVFDASAFGILELTLRPDGYDWRFVPEAGKTFTDSGSGACHGEPGRDPAEADFDGDRDSEIGIWRPSNGLWALQGLPWVQFGIDGDVPVPAEYDGDDDIAIFRPSNGVWAINGLPWAQFGIDGDIPVPADYDGDGDDDIAVFRPSSGLWAIRGQPWVSFGIDGDVPLPADYDGDGDADIAVFRPSNGLWAIDGRPWAQLGIDGDVPVPADYDGDGDANIAVFRPSNGLWAIDGQAWAQFGIDGDVPLSASAGVRFSLSG